MIGCLDHFTPQWLAQALGVDPDAIEALEIGPVGTGQIAATYRIALTGRDYRGPASIIAKVPSEDEASRKTGIALGLYRRELDWYGTFAAQSDVRCPRHILSELSTNGDAFALLLEDCAPARQGDQLAGATIAEIDAALIEAAHLHGAFLRNPSATAELLVPVDANVLAQRIDLFRKSWPVFRERNEGVLDAELLEVGNRLSERYDIYAHRAPTILSVVHKDFRIDNMLFGGIDGRVVILDWQTFAAGHPMTDVAYLIGTSIADADARSRHERRLVDDYCARLGVIAPNVDLGGFWDEYRLQAFWAFIMAVTSSVRVARTERGDAMFAIMAGRPARQILDLDSLALLG